MNSEGEINLGGGRLVKGRGLNAMMEKSINGDDRFITRE